MSVNILFLHDEYYWRHKTVFGSWMKAVAITAQSAGSSDTIKALYNVDTPAFVNVTLRGKSVKIHAGERLDLKGVKMHLTGFHVFMFSNGAWAVGAKSRFLPYKQLNKNKCRLDLTLHPIGDVDHDPVAPHGTS